MLVQPRKIDRRRLHTAHLHAAAAQADAREDVVAPAGEPPQHRGGFFIVFWLAEDFAVHDDGGVGAEDDDVLV